MPNINVCVGAPLIIHPGRDNKAPFEILDILERHGADLSHTVMSHLDRTLYEEAELLEFAVKGCYLEYDFFGVECSHYQVYILYRHCLHACDLGDVRTLYRIPSKARVLSES